MKSRENADDALNDRASPATNMAHVVARGDDRYSRARVLWWRRSISESTLPGGNEHERHTAAILHFVSTKPKARCAYYRVL